MRLGFGPQDWDLGLKAEIWAWRWGGVQMSVSIGPPPHRGHCPERERKVKNEGKEGKGGKEGKIGKGGRMEGSNGRKTGRKKGGEGGKEGRKKNNKG